MPAIPDDIHPASAAELMIGRIRATADEVGDRFPLHADPATGRWTTTRRGSWTGGFWAGLLWLVAARTAAPEDRARALSCTRRLRERAQDDTDTRALTFWYGAARGHLLCGDAEAADVAHQGAAALADSWRPDGGFVPAGTALGRGSRGASTLTVDAAGAVTALLMWAGRSRGQAGGRPAWDVLAEQHATAVLHHCLGGDGAVRPSAVPVPGAPDWSPADAHAPGTWARGQAWGISAFATAADLMTGSRAVEFRDAACRAADLWLDRTGSRVPPWSFTDPSGPRDTSAAAIAAEAMLVLAGTLDGALGARYHEAAATLTAELITRHLTRPGAGAGAPPAGMLLDGCYDMASGTALADELVWGDYFLLSTLLRLESPAVAVPGG